MNEEYIQIINDAISCIRCLCKANNDCIHCPMNHNCNNQPEKWEDVKDDGINPEQSGEQE